ncbi:MAG: ComF family protein [Actinomycetes bacterium]
MTTPPQRPRTVDQVAAPYENFLVRVPPAGDKVCTVCHSMVAEGYTTCYPCQEAKWALDSATADITAFVSMAPRGEQMARELLSYKDTRVPDQHRTRMVTGLGAVLWKWLGRHELCVARPLGFDGFDVVTTVPSTSGRQGHHPLVQVVAGVVTGSEARYEDLLVLRRPELEQRAHAMDRYATTREVTGRRVLVVDDTWTTGAHAQSARGALKAAGASGVAIVAIGRWFNPGYRDGGPWLAEHRKPGWDWDTCCLEQ